MTHADLETWHKTHAENFLAHTTQGKHTISMKCFEINDNMDFFHSWILKALILVKEKKY